MPIKKTKYLPLIILPVIFILCFGLWAVDAVPVECIGVESATGEFDMRKFDFHNAIASPAYTVEYIPGELLTPEEFALSDNIEVGAVPDKAQVCTMRVRYLVPDGISYGLLGYSVNYASKVYINGGWIFDAGKPAMTLEDEQSTEAFRLFSAKPEDGVIEIVIQTSAFSNLDSSSGMQWYIGEYEHIRVLYARTIMLDFVVMSWYILLALVALLLFLVLPDYKANGWLCLFSIVWALRVGLKGRKILLTLFPEHIWSFVYKLEIITSPLTIILFALILHSIFSGTLPRWLRAALIGGSALAALAVIILPWQTFLGHSVWSNPIIYWSIAVMLGFILFAIRRTRPTLQQIISLVGMGLVVFAFVWDENYFGNRGLPFTFAITQPMMIVFTMLILATTLLDTMRKTVQREVELAGKVERQEVELRESRIDIMLSQIQPHFLYNSLSSIAALCDISPHEVKGAVESFAHYLRGNLESIGQRNLINFEDELLHIETYLSLEKLRHGDELNIDYDIELEDFKLPPLTVQPIVENAVKSGVMKKRGGGTVRVAVSRSGDIVRIVVADDGAGFDSLKQIEDGRRHVGIENVRQRLTTQSGGTLEIESKPGAGTTAVIKVPYIAKEDMR